MQDQHQICLDLHHKFYSLIHHEKLASSAFLSPIGTVHGHYFPHEP